ncbi:hypothetical protein HZC21_05720 [Candidatus Peregrinibacteria bacterium]|nr:hypothetical protein [Candidatus Peregrinibacteria bacterium]
MTILEKYAALLKKLDEKCEEIYAEAKEIPCKNKCTDCCKQLFPLSFVEAYYISEGIKKLDRSLRRELKRKAEKINGKILAKNPFQFEKNNADKRTALNTHADFARFLHEINCDCPALFNKNPNGACTIYDFRNHDCRSMGASFDASSNEIIGCYRFNSLKYLAPRLMPFNFLYPEKMQLDKKLIAEVTAGAFSPNILYYTTICTPFLKDYAEQDWIKFFEEKGAPKKTENDKYRVVIDV